MAFPVTKRIASRSHLHVSMSPNLVMFRDARASVRSARLKLRHPLERGNLPSEKLLFRVHKKARLFGLSELNEQRGRL